nr:capsid protein [Cressdnaviricota sp.]
MYKRAREEFDGYRQFLRRTQPRIDRSAVTVRRYTGGVSKHSNTAQIRPRGVLRTAGLPLYPSNVEKKFADVTSVADITATPTVLVLNGTSRGTNVNERIGYRILVKSIQLKATMVRENAATTTLQQVHLTIVYDRQTNGAAPAYADVWGGNTFPGTDLRNNVNMGRFFVIWDHVENIEGVNQGGSSSKFVEFFRKVNLPVYYNAGTAGDVTDIATGGLFLLIKGSTAAGADDVDTTISTRIRFTDM